MPIRNSIRNLYQAKGLISMVDTVKCQKGWIKVTEKQTINREKKRAKVKHNKTKVSKSKSHLFRVWYRKKANK